MESEAIPLPGKNLDGTLLSTGLFCVLWKMSEILKNKQMKGQVLYPKPETPLLLCREGIPGEKPPLLPAGTGSGKRQAAKRGPDAAPSKGSLVLGHSGGWACPTSPPPCPPPCLFLGPPTPRRAPGLAADICGPEFIYPA